MTDARSDWEAIQNISNPLKREEALASWAHEHGARLLGEPDGLDDAVTERAQYPTFKTLRDEFAIAGLAMIPVKSIGSEVASLAYKFADAMMEARKA